MTGWSTRALTAGTFLVLILCAAAQTGAQIPTALRQKYLSTLELFGAERYGAFLEQNKKLIQSYPDLCQLYEKQAEAYHYAGRPQEAERFFRRRLAADSTDAITLYSLGFFYYLERKYDEALPLLQRSLQLGVGCDKIYIDLADCYARAKTPAAAVKFFEDFVQRDPNNPFGYLALGYLYQRQSLWDKSAEFLQKAIDLAPNLWRGFYLFSRLEVVRGLYREALKYLTRVDTLTSKDVNDPEVFAKIDARRATILSSLGNLREANTYFVRALEVFRKYGVWPELAASLNNYGTNLLSLGEYRRAISVFTEAKEAYEKVNYRKGVGFALGNIGNAYSKMGFLSKGLEFYRATLAIAREVRDPNFERLALSDIGETYRALGNYSKAVQLFLQARQVAESMANKWVDGVILQNLAELSLDLGNATQALQYAQQSIDAFRQAGDQRRVAGVLILLAEIHRDLHSLTEARDALREAETLAQRIGDPALRLNSLLLQGRLRLAGNDPGAAVREIARARTLAHQTGDAQAEVQASIYLGRAYLKLNRLSVAESLLQKTVSRAHEGSFVDLTWRAYAELAKCFVLRGKTEEALKAYHRAIDILESLQTTTQNVPFYTDFLRDRIDVYVAYVQLLARQDRLQDAFLQLLALERNPGFAPNLAADLNLRTAVPESLKVFYFALATRLQRTHAALSRELAYAEGKATRKVSSLEQQVALLTARRDSLLSVFRQRYGYEKWPAHPRSPQAVTAELHPHQAVVKYLVGEEKTSVFLFLPSGMTYLELDTPRDSLRVALRPLLRPGSRPEETGDRFLTARDLDLRLPALSKLYRLVFKPLEPYLAGVRELTVLPDDAL
ncbi:MAG: hypothetical protein D6743_10430, partial [Calditrichaeota bacterium]